MESICQGSLLLRSEEHFYIVIKTTEKTDAHKAHR